MNHEVDVSKRLFPAHFKHKTKINNETVRHVYIQSETFKNQTKSDK